MKLLDQLTLAYKGQERTDLLHEYGEGVFAHSPYSCNKAYILSKNRYTYGCK